MSDLKWGYNTPTLRRISVNVTYVHPHADLALIRLKELDDDHARAPGLCISKTLMRRGDEVISIDMSITRGRHRFQIVHGNIFNPELPVSDPLARTTVDGMFLLYATDLAANLPVRDGAPVLHPSGNGDPCVVAVKSSDLPPRSGIHLAITANAVLEALAEAQVAVSESQTQNAIPLRLKNAANSFAEELSSLEPRLEHISPLVSFRLATGQLGRELYRKKMLSIMTAGDGSEVTTWAERPVKAMRILMAMSFLQHIETLRKGERSVDVSVKHIHARDLQISSSSDSGIPHSVRIAFKNSIGGTYLTTWISEHGHWRLAKARGFDSQGNVGIGQAGTKTDSP